jgi:hypothetical protein
VTQVTYQFDMTKQEVRRAMEAARLVQKIAKGEQLYTGLTIGEQLLTGRAHAMKAANNNKPFGQRYAEAFRQWKGMMKFPAGKEYEALYDAAIVCAQHRSIAEEVIANLDVKQRGEIGIFGLAVRVRRKAKELDGEEKSPHLKPGPRGARNQLAGLLADVEERLTAARAENPFNYWEKSPVEVARILVRANPAAAQKLARSIDEAHARRAGHGEEGDELSSPLAPTARHYE